MTILRRAVTDGCAERKDGRLNVGKGVWFLALPCQAPRLVVLVGLLVADAIAGAALRMGVHQAQSSQALLKPLFHAGETRKRKLSYGENLMHDVTREEGILGTQSHNAN